MSGVRVRSGADTNVRSPSMCRWRTPRPSAGHSCLRDSRTSVRSGADTNVRYPNMCRRRTVAQRPRETTLRVLLWSRVRSDQGFRRAQTVHGGADDPAGVSGALSRRKQPAV